MAATSAARKSLCLSFAGSGFLGVYHVGVIDCLMEHGRRWLDKVDCYAGASAGALVAAIMALGEERISIPDAMEFVLNLAGDVHKRRLGAFSPGMNLLDPMSEYLHKVIPPDGHQVVNGRLYVSVTNARTWKNELVSEFATREELIQYLLASCCVPGFNQGGRAVSVAEKRYFDGGITTNLPQLKECTTVCVSPFCCRIVEICPKDKKAFGPFLKVSGQTLQLSRVNIFRLKHALFPPNRQEMMKYYAYGFRDARRFVAFQDLFADGCDPAESSLTLDDIELETEEEMYKVIKKRHQSGTSQNEP